MTAYQRQGAFMDFCLKDGLYQIGTWKPSMFFSKLASKSRGPKVAGQMTQAASANATLINRPTGGKLTVQVCQIGCSIPVYTPKQCVFNSTMCVSPWFHACGWQPFMLPWWFRPSHLPQCCAARWLWTSPFSFSHCSLTWWINVIYVWPLGLLKKCDPSELDEWT